MARSKIVFVSDVHMGNGEYYTWFPETEIRSNNYPDNIAGMLEQLAADEEVKELVLLGDFFDLWMYPTHMAPWTFEQIVDKWNDKVIEPLRKCVANLPNVYYLNGNHDMSVTADQVTTIQAGGKCVQWISYEDYCAKYAGIIHAEHGNAIDMFNAPDKTTDSLNGKPLGYYMARIIADKPEPTSPKYKRGKSVWNDMTNVIEKSCQDYTPDNGTQLGAKMVEQLVDLLMDQTNSYGGSVNDDTEFVFDDSLENATIGTLKKHYHNILNQWAAKAPGTLSDYALAMFKPGRTGLNWYAKYLVETGKAKVVIFGHVHQAEWDKYEATGNSGTYINDGCWCDATPDPQPRYAIVEIQPGEEVDMRLMGWGHILDVGSESLTHT